MSKGLKGHALVGEVLSEWESIVCGKSAWWWDSEVKEIIRVC